FSFFFFSSRRRHTRFSRDWSSDVCSSDLFLARRRSSEPVLNYVGVRESQSGNASASIAASSEPVPHQEGSGSEFAPQRKEEGGKIGRASCRGRGEKWGVAVARTRQEERER